MRISTADRHGRNRLRARSGSSALELHVAFTVFALALAGVFPLAATYMKLAQRLDAMMPAYGGAPSGEVTHYLIPPAYRWNGRFGPAWIQSTLPLPVPRTLDDGDPTVRLQSTSQTGWQRIPSASAINGALRRHDAAANGGGSITWSFPAAGPDQTGLTGLMPGIYNVYTTWPKDPALCSSVTIQVQGASALDGLDEQKLDQTKDPQGLTDVDGRVWQPLRNRYRTVNGALQVQILTDSSKPVAADAVRVISAPRNVQLLSAPTLTDGGAMMFQALVPLK